jgi:hypothetical protein
VTEHKQTGLTLAIRRRSILWRVALLLLLTILLVGGGIVYSKWDNLRSLVLGSHFVGGSSGVAALHMPPGFQASVFYSGLEAPRFILVAKLSLSPWMLKGRLLVLPGILLRVGLSDTPCLEGRGLCLCSTATLVSLARCQLWLHGTTPHGSPKAAPRLLTRASSLSSVACPLPNKERY